MKAISIPLPPKFEQQRILAGIEEQFSRLDGAEAALKAALRRQQFLRSAAVSLALAGDWPIRQLSDVTAEKTYGSSAKASAQDRDGVPIVRMGNIRDGRVDLSRDVKYLPYGHPDVDKHALQPGDLLFNRTNSPELVGKSAVYDGREGEACFASYLIRVRLDESCLPAWAALYINSREGRRWAASVRTQQVGQANINGTKLAAMPLPLPPVEEQEARIAEFNRQSSILDSLAAATESALLRSERLRRSILELAFTGRLVPQDPSDQPASVLLEKMRTERFSRKGTPGQRMPVGTVKQ
jgi:type I restriction enzyme S subunit